MKPQSRVSHLVRQNGAYQCNVAGCSKPRVSLSPYCSRHYSAVARNGHPTAPPVRETLWKPYRTRVRGMLEANTSHPLVASSLTVVEHMLTKAASLAGRRGYAWATELSRVARHGVTPFDLLTELCAVYAALHDQPHATRSTEHRTHAIGKAVCFLAPQPRRGTDKAAGTRSNGYSRRPRPSAVRYLGLHLPQALAPLLASVLQGLEQEQARAEAEVAAMRQPLAPSRAAIERALRATPDHHPNSHYNQ